MVHTARGQSKKVAILCEGHAPCCQGISELSFIVLAAHSRFNDRDHIDPAST